MAEAGATVWLAQDVYVVGLSAAYNQAGLDQLLPLVELTAGVEELKVLTIRCQGALYFDRTTGASAHVTNLLAPLDVDKVLAYKPGIDTATLLWLERNGYHVVEADFEEHVAKRRLQPEDPRAGPRGDGRRGPAHDREGAGGRRRGHRGSRTRASRHAGGGFHCTTMEIYREPGPLLADR